MSRRLRRILVRTGVVILVLLVLGLAAFTWLAWWPLEGDVDQIVTLIPANVDFVYRASWKGLKNTQWIQQNLEAHPVLPQVKELIEQVRTTFETQIVPMEDQINHSIPGGLATFSFEDDVVGSEVIAAGRFCEEWDPAKGPPTWRELLFLTRITWKVKFFSMLKHGWVRSMLEPDVTVTDEGNGLFKFLVHTIRPSPRYAREGCGPAVVVPPENLWYGRRVGDVLVFGNSEYLMREVGNLADFPDSGRSYLDVPWVKLDAPPDTIAASIDMHPLETYLHRLIQMSGPPVTILRQFLRVEALVRMNGRLVLPGRDLVRGEAEIRYDPSAMGRGVQEVYALDPEDLSQTAASILPAEDTFGALLLRTPPNHLIQAIYNDILTPGDRQLWNENLRKMGRYESITDFFKEFADKLSDTAAIAVGRMSEVFDDVDYESFYTDPSIPDPNWPALAMMVKLKRDTLRDELDAYLAERVPLLGGSTESEAGEHRGMPYTRIRLEVQTADYQTVQPAYFLSQDHFIFSSSEQYLRKIIDTIVDPQAHPPLSSDPAFRIAMKPLPQQVHLAFFLDVEKLFRVPTHRGRGSMPRGYMWDRRNIWVMQNRDPNREAGRYRQELETKIRQSSSGRLGPEALEEIDRQVADHWEAWQNDYPRFEEDYRKQLESFRRLSAFSAGIVARRPTLEVRFALLLRHPDDESAGK